MTFGDKWWLLVVQVDWSRPDNYESNLHPTCARNEVTKLMRKKNLQHNSNSLLFFSPIDSLLWTKKIATYQTSFILMTEFRSFPEFSWLFLSSVVCLAWFFKPCHCMQQSRCPGVRSAKWPWNNSMQALVCWAGILELFTKWQLFPGFEHCWIEFRARNFLKNHRTWKKNETSCWKSVDPLNGIYHLWWGNVIHSKKQRFGSLERSKSAGALVSRQGDLMFHGNLWGTAGVFLGFI